MAFLVAVGLAAAQPANAERVYRYVDEEGNVHMTDDPGSIPPEYRERVEVRALGEGPEPGILDRLWDGMGLGRKDAPSSAGPVDGEVRKAGEGWERPGRGAPRGDEGSRNAGVPRREANGGQPGLDGARQAPRPASQGERGSGDAGGRVQQMPSKGSTEGASAGARAAARSVAKLAADIPWLKLLLLALLAAWFSGLALVVPLLAVLLTLAYVIWRWTGAPGEPWLRTLGWRFASAAAVVATAWFLLLPAAHAYRELFTEFRGLAGL